MFETLLVATDGSHAAQKAVEYAVEFAKRHDSRLIICTVTSEKLVRLKAAEPEPRRTSTSRWRTPATASPPRLCTGPRRLAKAAGVKLRAR